MEKQEEAVEIVDFIMNNSDFREKRLILSEFFIESARRVIYYTVLYLIKNEEKVSLNSICKLVADKNFRGKVKEIANQEIEYFSADVYNIIDCVDKEIGRDKKL